MLPNNLPEEGTTEREMVVIEKYFDRVQQQIADSLSGKLKSQTGEFITPLLQSLWPMAQEMTREIQAITKSDADKNGIVRRYAALIEHTGQTLQQCASSPEERLIAALQAILTKPE